MDALLLKFQASPLPHFFIVATFTSLTQSYASYVAPYLKGIMGTMTTNMKAIKKDNLKYAYASAFSGSAEAILEIMANEESDSATKENYHSEVDFAHDVMFSQWLSSRYNVTVLLISYYFFSRNNFDEIMLNNAFVFRDSKVRNGTLEALGKMSRLLSRERLLRNASPILTALIGIFKRTSEPFYVTSCVFQTVKAICEVDPNVMEGVVEQLLTALFTQVKVMLHFYSVEIPFIVLTFFLFI